MILSGERIKELIKIDAISIDPIDLELQLQESSLDIRLSERIYRYPKELEPEISMLDISNPCLNLLEKDFISDSGFVLKPKTFVIAESYEYITTPEYINVFLDSKFRLDKFGLLLTNKGWLGCGFEGFVTLCLYNTGDIPVRLFKFGKIAQLVFSKIE